MIYSIIFLFSYVTPICFDVINPDRSNGNAIAALAMAAGPTMLGFTSTGIWSNSIAALWMSSYGGTVNIFSCRRCCDTACLMDSFLLQRLDWSYIAYMCSHAELFL
eukprot:Rmarinus@m.12308